MGEAALPTARLQENYSYTLADFETPEPYAYLWQIHEQASAFLYQTEKEKLAKYAKGVGFRRFATMLRAYEATERKDKHLVQTVYNNGLVTQFDEQPIELDCGEWEAHDYGIFREGSDGRKECACAHPIMPVERLVNIDTGEVKVKLAYKRSGKLYKWQYVTVDKETVSSARTITALSKVGIAVTSNSAKTLVDYLSDIENRNYDLIPERKSVGRCGYIPGEGFSPFVDNLVFDGEASFRHIFSAISAHGLETTWFETAAECRRMSVTARIMLSASFASVLLEPFGALPFFVHLWGADSGTGKTVALMLAASVWGNPELGAYTATFNATAVGSEYLAAFLNHLPLCMDELQLTKDSSGKTRFDVYQISQGVGRTRGNKSGGISATPTWKNCILTTGETPITGTASGAGAVNRVIDIECTANTAVIRDGMRISSALKQNYGFAGRRFVDEIYRKDGRILKMLEQIYQMVFAQMSKSDTTEKQAMAAAAICAADVWLTDSYFRDGLPPLDQEIQGFLASKQAVSIGARAYDFLCDWIAQNTNKLCGTSATGDVYGVVEENKAYIIRAVFNRVMADAGFSVQPVLSWMKSEGRIETSGKGCTKSKRINGIPTNCVVVVLDFSGDAPDEDELPL